MPPPRAVSPERGISEALERVILRAVAPSPYVRFGTADELMDALQSAGAQPANPKRRPAQRPRKWTAMVAAGCAAVAVLGAGALRSQRPPGAECAAGRPDRRGRAAAERTGEGRRPGESQPLPRRPRPRRPVDAAGRPNRNPPTAAAAAPARAAQVAADEPRGSAESVSAARSGRCSTADDWTKARAASSDSSPRIPTRRGRGSRLGCSTIESTGAATSVREWRLALAQNPEIRHDPQFGAYLCFMLDDAWKAAGVTELLGQLGTARSRSSSIVSRRPRLRGSAHWRPARSTTFARPTSDSRADLLRFFFLSPGAPRTAPRRTHFIATVISSGRRGNMATCPRAIGGCCFV